MDGCVEMKGMNANTNTLLQIRIQRSRIWYKRITKFIFLNHFERNCMSKPVSNSSVHFSSHSVGKVQEFRNV